MRQFYSLCVPHNLRWWQRFRQRPNSIEHIDQTTTLKITKARNSTSFPFPYRLYSNYSSLKIGIKLINQRTILKITKARSSTTIIFPYRLRSSWRRLRFRLVPQHWHRIHQRPWDLGGELAVPEEEGPASHCEVRGSSPGACSDVSTVSWTGPDLSNSHR